MAVVRSSGRWRQRFYGRTTMTTVRWRGGGFGRLCATRRTYESDGGRITGEEEVVWCGERERWWLLVMMGEIDVVVGSGGGGCCCGRRQRSKRTSSGVSVPEKPIRFVVPGTVVSKPCPALFRPKLVAALRDFCVFFRPLLLFRSFRSPSLAPTTTTTIALHLANADQSPGQDRGRYRWR